MNKTHFLLVLEDILYRFQDLMKKVLDKF